MPYHLDTGRPVAQRGVRRHGFIQSLANVTLAAGALTLALSLPDASISTGTAQNVSAGSQTLTLSLPTAVRFLPSANLAAGQQAIALSLPTANPVAGPVTIQAGSQTLTLSLPDVAGGGIGYPVPVPYRRGVGQRGIMRYGPPSYTATPENSFPQTLAASPVVLTVSAPDVVRIATVTLPATATILTLSAPSVTVEQPTAGVSENPIITKPRLLTRARFTAMRPVIAGHGVIEQLAPETFTRAAGSQAVTLSVPSVTQVPGVSTQTSGSVALALSLPSVSLIGGSGFLSTGTGNLTLSLPDVTVVSGATTKAAGNHVVTLSLPDVVANRVVAVTPTTVALSLPATTVSQASVRGTGTANLALSLPAVTVAVTAQNRAAGEQAIALSVPAVIRRAGVGLPQGDQAVALSLPTVSVVVGPTTVVLSPVVLTLRAGAPTVLGATELPAEVFEGTLESRFEERTLASRFLDRALRVTT